MPPSRATTAEMPPRAVEDYLRTIQALDDDGVEVIQARIAERLGNKAPSVAQMLERLTTDGYVWRSGRLIHLTDRGRQVAAEVIRKHRLASRLLVDVLGIPDELARAEADRWGHVMSDDVASRIAALLADSANRIPAVPSQARASHGGTAPALALNPREEDGGGAIGSSTPRGSARGTPS
jgi:DtxR family transcriptional regulator, Mn-dependent transcriptional regulator